MHYTKKLQKTLSNKAILRWVKPESCNPEREITQSDLKEEHTICTIFKHTNNDILNQMAHMISKFKDNH